MVQATPGQHLNGHIKFEMVVCFGLCSVPSASRENGFSLYRQRMRARLNLPCGGGGSTLEKILSYSRFNDHG